MVRKKVTAGIFWVCLFCVFDLTQAVPPVLTIPPGKTVVTLNEKTATREELVPGIECTGGGAVRVFSRSVSPISPCGTCFAVWPKAAAGRYALYYNPGNEPLNYAATSGYNVRVECTDGVETSQGIIEVRLLPNSPPIFVTPATSFVTHEITGADRKKVGSTLYTAASTDPDVDAVFYSLETDPNTDLFEIGRSDGIIRNTGDLRFLCSENVIFKIKTFDDFNNPVGPREVSTKLKFAEDPGTPFIINTEKVLEQLEDPDDEDPALKAVKDFELKTTPRNARRYNWKMTADPARGLEYYKLDVDNAKIKAKKRLDYEYEPLRSVTLYLTANNGFCESQTYSVRIDLTDVNEPPLVFPGGTKTVEIERTVYEGLISFYPNVTIKDPDLDENLKWVLKSPTDAFHVDATTGEIISAGEFDVDKNTQFKSRTLELEVEDKNGEKAKVTVKLTILDKNDNAPQFTQSKYERSATECSPVGKDLPPKLNTIDFDSPLQGNSRMILSGRGGNLTVTGTGHIILMNKCTAGDIDTFTVYVEDQGTYPGPLQGIPSTVSFNCKECPPTTVVPPVTDPTSGSSGSDSSDSDSSEIDGVTDGPGSNDNDFTSNPKLYCAKRRNSDKPRCRVYTLDNMNDPGYATPNDWDFLGGSAGWIVAATLVTAIFLALLVYMLWQHCWKGLMAARPAAKRTPKPIKVKSKPKPQKQQPPPEQPPPPPPPPELQPYNEPRLFGFWKETFPDRDQRQMPQRDVVPMNVAQDSKIDQKNKVEEQQEKQQWREERGQQVTKFQQEMQSYSHKYGGQAADANAYWFSGTTGQAIRGGTGEEIAPTRQWDTKPAGGEYSSTLQAAPPTGQPPADTSRAAPAPKPQAPGPSTAAAASDPAVQAWYNESSIPTQSGNNGAGSYSSGRMW